MPGVEDLKRHVQTLDASGLGAVLGTMDAEERAAARAWVLKSRHFFRDLWQVEHRAAQELHGTLPWMRVMCLISLCPPVEAARAIRWEDLWTHMTPVACDLAFEMLIAKPLSWAQLFLETVSATRLSKSELNRNAGALERFVDGGLAAHDLPCPDGLAFLQSHLVGDATWRPFTADQIRHDRLVPDIVYLKIRRGLAAQLSSLEDLLGELVDDGTLDRAELVRSCLESLTFETRPGSQRAVVRFMSVLDVKVEEVPGGFAFLAGVIATSDGVTASYFLPMALERVETVADVVELTAVIAGRKELKLKRALLSGLNDAALLARIGDEGVREGLELLLHGLEDSSLAAKIHKRLAAMGVAPALADPDAVLGLWELELNPGPERTWSWWLEMPHTRARYQWRSYLDRSFEDYPDAFEFIADGFARELAASGAANFLERCRELRREGRLGLQRLIRLAEPAILAGGLSVLWPALLEVVDGDLSAGSISTGMPDLLRMLRRYAAEVPHGPVPSSLVDLAAANGATKSQHEARALLEALDYLDRPDHTRSVPVTSTRPTRSLWTAPSAPGAAAESLRLYCDSDGRVTAFGWTLLLRSIGQAQPRVMGVEHERERVRAEILGLSAAGALDPAVTVAASDAFFAAETCSLSALAASLQALFETGAIRDLWPVGMAVAATAAASDPKPNGLAVLLTALCAYTAEVPQPERAVPDSIRAYAATPGRSKSHAAARELVAALEPAANLR